MIGVSIVGVDDLKASLEGLSKRVKKEIGIKAVVSALTPMEVKARSNVPVDTGNLKASIGIRSKAYRGGANVFGVVGARSKFVDPATGRIATKYAHLVENGYAKKGGGTVAGKYFMARAFESTKAQMQQTLGVVMGQEIQLAAQKVSRRRKRSS